MKLLLVGATGLVGSHVLTLALNDKRISKVVVLTRSNIAPHPKLEIIETDFDHLDDNADWWNVDSVICTLGTTMRKAKSKAQFRRVDFDYPLAVAAIARQHGVSSFVLNSSMGANTRSLFFYSRVKGDIEEGITKLGFPSFTIVRPGLIDGQRNETRVGEKIMIRLLKILGVVLPKVMRVNRAHTIAQKMIEASNDKKLGTTIIQSYQLL